MALFAPILTTLGKYSTAQLIIPPLVLAGTVSSAKYAYKKYNTYFAKKKTHLTNSEQQRLNRHNYMVDMMRRRWLHPFFKYRERDSVQKEAKMAEQMRRHRRELRGTTGAELNAQAEYSRAMAKREKERSSTEAYINKLRAREERRATHEEKHQPSKWNPTNWFNVDRHSAARQHYNRHSHRRYDDDDDPGGGPRSPFDHGGPNHRHPNGGGGAGRNPRSGGRRR